MLPIEQELLRGPLNESDEDYDIEEYIDKMKDLKQGLYEKAHRNIKLSQIRQKTDYDKKLKRLGVCFHFIDCSINFFSYLSAFFLASEAWNTCADEK